MTSKNPKNSVSATPARGRPRDAELEDRVFDAVLAIYSRGGWGAFTFEAVARDSGVGKSSLYRRWDNREHLLQATLEARWLPVHQIDTGDLREDLHHLADMIFDNRTGKMANMENWFRMDAYQHPEVREVTAPFVETAILQGRQLVRRAVTRGELSSSLNPGLLMDLIVGAVNNHVLTTPASLRDKMLEQAPEFIDTLVNVVLNGVAAEKK